MSNIHHNHTDLFLKSFDSLSQICNSKILDVGCGDGYAAQQFVLLEAGEVHTYDPYKPKPEICQSLGIQHFTKVDELHSEYDLIWMHHVLEHVPDYLALLKLLRSKLKDSGELWMAVPNMASHSVFSPGHINNFMAPQLVEILRIAGFAVGNISIWVHEGQLRVRVPVSGSTEYPEPMKKSLKETGRCASEILKMHNW